MTHHVAHTNKMISDLKEQHNKKIEELQNKISQLEEEIKLIQQFDGKIYDL